MTQGGFFEKRPPAPPKTFTKRYLGKVGKFLPLSKGTAASSVAPIHSAPRNGNQRIQKIASSRRVCGKSFRPPFSKGGAVEGAEPSSPVATGEILDPSKAPEGVNVGRARQRGNHKWGSPSFSWIGPFARSLSRLRRQLPPPPKGGKRFIKRVFPFVFFL